MRLVIHAGFRKCGSSSIQRALQKAAPTLKTQSTYLFGSGLRLDDGFWTTGSPFWIGTARAFRDPRIRGEFPDRILRELDRVSRKAPNATAIISNEVLGAPGSEQAFRTIDAKVDTTVVFYVRPQIHWIPSAWKQWSMPKGISLEKFVTRCVASHNPDFRKSLEGWARELPRAKLVVRVLPQVIADVRGPAQDFFGVLGLHLDPTRLDNPRANPNLDFSILHVLSKNPWLFKDGIGNEVFEALATALPEQFLTTNINMLSFEQEQMIADHFLDDNMCILKRFAGLSDGTAQAVYANHYRPREASRSYADVKEVEHLRRCLGILVAILLRDRQRPRPIIRPPYWKVPWRFVKRMVGSV